MIDDKLKLKIKEHALLEKPNEACGLLLNINGINEIFSCKNISSNKLKFFEIDSIDYLKASKVGKIYGFYHSQKTSEPSELDKMQNKIHNLESYIYSWEEDKIIKCEEEPRKYVEKQFQIGINDCFTLVRSYYKNEFKILINDYPRNEKWYENNPNIFLENFKNEGFIEVDIKNIKKNDVLIFDKHLAIYVGNNIILHHPKDKYSLTETLNDSLKRRIKKVVRHNLFINK